MKEKMVEGSNSYVTERGDKENWKGGFDKEYLEKELEEGLEYLEKLKIK